MSDFPVTNATVRDWMHCVGGGQRPAAAILASSSSWFEVRYYLYFSLHAKPGYFT